MSDKKLTHEEKQLMVDKIYPAAIEDYNRMLKQSGKSDLMFKISHEAMQFMGKYQCIKEIAESQGFTMPELFKGTKITLGYRCK